MIGEPNLSRIDLVDEFELDSWRVFSGSGSGMKMESTSSSRILSKILSSSRRSVSIPSSSSWVWRRLLSSRCSRSDEKEERYYSGRLRSFISLRMKCELTGGSV